MRTPGLRRGLTHEGHLERSHQLRADLDSDLRAIPPSRLRSASSFRLLHRKDHAPIQYKKFCSKEDIEVPNDEIVRGYEVEDDEYTVVEKEELDKVEDEASPEKGEMEVLQFVDFGAPQSARRSTTRTTPRRARAARRRTACCATR